MSPGGEFQWRLNSKRVATHHENPIASQPVALPVMGNLVEHEGGEFSCALTIGVKPMSVG